MADLADVKISMNSKDVQTASQNFKQLDQSVKQTGDGTKNMSADFNKAGTSLSGLKVAAIAAAAAVAALSALRFGVGIMSDLLATADAVAKMSARTGVAVEELQKLQYAAGQADVTNETLQRSLTKLTQELNGVADGNKASVEAFKKLGISIRDTNGKMKSTDQVFRDVANRVANATTELERASIASSVFGNKMGPELLPLLKQGEAGLAQLGTEAERLGLILSADTAAAAEVFNDAMVKIKGIGTGLMYEVFAPMISQLADLATGFFEAYMNGETFFGSLERGFQKMTQSTDLLKLAKDLENASAKVEALSVTWKGMAQDDYGQLTPYGRALEEVGVKTAEYMRAANALTASTKETAVQLGAVEVVTDRVTAAVKASVPEVISKAEAWEQFGKALPNSHIQDLFKGLTQSRTAVDRLKSAVDPAYASLKKAEQVWNELTLAVSRGVITMEEAADIFRKTFETNDVVALVENQTDVFENLWTNTIDRLDETFANLWKGTADGFKSFSEGLKTSFRNLLGEMAHMAFTRPILVQLGAAGGLAGMGGNAAASGGSSSGGGMFSMPGGGSMISGMVNGIASMAAGTALGSFGAGVASGMASWTMAGASVMGTASAGAAVGGAVGAGMMIGTAIPIIGVGLALASMFGGQNKPTNYWQHTARDLQTGEITRQTNNPSSRRHSPENLSASDQLSMVASEFVQGIHSMTGEWVAETINFGVGSRDKRVTIDGEDLGGGRLYRTSNEEALNLTLITLLDRSTELSETFKTLVISMESAEDKLHMFNALAAFDKMKGVNVTETASDNLAAAQRTATEIYQTQVTAVRELISTYDGSLHSTNELVQAYGLQQQMAYELAFALNIASLEIERTFMTLHESILQSLMGEEELYNHRRTQVDDLVLAMSTMTDPAQMMAASAEIERITSQMWSSLAEDQRQAMGQGFLTFLEDVNGLAQTQIQNALEGIDADQIGLSTDASDAMDRAAATQMEAANANREAAQNMISAANQMTGAAHLMIGAVSNIRVSVDVNQPAVGY